MFQASNSGTPVPPIIVPTTATSDQWLQVRHLVFGPLVALRETTKTLHIRGYAEVNDWSQPQPSGETGEFVTVLIKKLRLE